MTSVPSDDPTVISLGCRLNAYEAEVMRGHAAEARLTDAVIVNTCAVTAEAEAQARQAIRKVRRDRPGARIVVTGCAVQISPERFVAMPEVDHVIGNAEKVKRVTFQSLTGVVGSAPRVQVGNIMDARRAAVQHANILGAPAARAFVEVQNGCDHRCTFCVIPYGRGPSRSVPGPDVVAQVRRLVERGVREVVLTGVDITAWGCDLGEGQSLGSLVRLVLHAVPELARLRLSSIDHAEADADLCAAVAEEERLMPHLHLSLQSGSDLILKRMKRRHSRGHAIAFCKEMRRLRPDIAIGADLIAGFPTECERHLADTMSLIDECGLSFLHVFPYSARAGTPAARMPQVPQSEVRDRAARLRVKGQQVLARRLSRLAGSHIEVALEQSSRPETTARTPQFELVLVGGLPTGRGAGETTMVHVESHDGRRLLAEAMA